MRYEISSAIVKKGKAAFVLFFFVFCISDFVCAATGAAFLKIGVGARALGMGGAFTAAADDATAAYWNPAGLWQLEKRQAAATHADWIGDIRYDHLAYAHPAKSGTTFGAGVALLRQGELERRGENREKMGSFAAQDNAVSLSLARPLSEAAGWGVTARWVEQRIDDERAAGLAADMGWLRRLGSRWRVGAALTNVGPAMRFLDEAYSLPSAVSVGLNYRVKGVLSAGVDGRRSLKEGKTSVSVGTEYWFLGRVAMRSGYVAGFGGSAGAQRSAADRSAARLGRMTGVNVGLGLRVSGYQMDYALMPSGEFGNTHRISLSFTF